MALSTLNPPLPALENLIALAPRPPQPTPKTTTKKKLGPRLSAILDAISSFPRELNDNDDEIECIYERIATILSRRHGRKVALHGVQYTVNSRGVALRKPPISEKNRLARLAYAYEHVH
jgi:hypothetical protein